MQRVEYQTADSKLGFRVQRPPDVLMRGRPPVIADIQQLVVRMATANRDWGYTRIQGAPANLGHTVLDAGLSPPFPRAAEPTRTHPSLLNERGAIRAQILDGMITFGALVTVERVRVSKYARRHCTPAEDRSAVA